MKYQVSFRTKTRYLHMWKYHRWNGYIINRTFHTKICWSKMVWYFIGVYIINRILHGRLEIRNFSSRVGKNISRVSAANEWNIFQHSKRNFVSPRGHVISSISWLCYRRIVSGMQKETEMIINTDRGKVADIWKRSRVIKSCFLPRQQMLFISQANKLKLNPVIDNEKFLVTFNYCFPNGLVSRGCRTG